MGCALFPLLRLKFSETMFSSVRSLSLALLLSLPSLPLLSHAQLQKGIEGQQAPLLNVSDWYHAPEGKDKVEITDYPGKIIVMLFFQHWCRASQERELPVLKHLVDHYKGNQEIVFLAIQTAFEGFLDNTIDKLPVTAEKFGLDIPIGHYTKAPGFPGVSGAYKPGGTPWWVIIDRTGRVEYNGFLLNEEEAIKGFDKMLAGQSPN